ncbi:hypothetical protein BDN72DRAFT_843377 [Pluteus cervinus]|uniref:Uncharacterized protein n=1 Tax=Pluteus cervinus TaxID=181527 RepID=A0ACD3ANB2_9AGAR|nr:hypothetical protein BDN72DRAFT_843377 [Pluteus cervinus]
MAADPQCSAVAAAKARSGLSYAQIAEKVGTTEQHVVDICTGTTKPTAQEYSALAKALNITEELPPGH